MKHPYKTLVVLLIVISALSSNTGKAQDIELDKKLGKENAALIASEMGIYSHASTSTYVKGIGDRLAVNVGSRLFDYKFEVVEMQEPNAFALPGGYIYVSRGLLCMINSEDELAGILGHEIVHSELRHSVQQMKKSIIPALLQVPGAVVGVVVDENLGKLINTPINASSKLFLASYSRKHEKEADTYGMRLMAKSGYNPAHFPVALHNLTQLVEVITGEKEEFTYFDSHPYTPKRVKYLNEQVGQMTYTQKPGIASTKNDFLHKLDGICVGPNPELGIFRDNEFLHPEMNLYMSFPEGWVTDNQPTAVGAMDTSDNKSMVVLGVAPVNTSPDSLGMQFVENLKAKNKVLPSRATALDLNGMAAYLVSITDSTGGEVMGIHSLWFRFNNTTFQLLGIATLDKMEALKKTALSIRKLSAEERQSIEMLSLRIREAKQGETLTQFCQRTGNAWNTELTAAMNNIKKDAALSQGQLLKIALKEKYVK